VRGKGLKKVATTKFESLSHCRIIADDDDEEEVKVDEAV
jgi:hypothetical protein